VKIHYTTIYQCYGRIMRPLMLPGPSVSTAGNSFGNGLNLSVEDLS